MPGFFGFKSPGENIFVRHVFGGALCLSSEKREH
jgi:hypothetical protein